jgi:hypothetical protein
MSSGIAFVLSWQTFPRQPSMLHGFAPDTTREGGFEIAHVGCKLPLLDAWPDFVLYGISPVR